MAYCRDASRLGAATRSVMAFSCLLLSGCGVILGQVGGAVGGAAYSASFRTTIEDASTLSSDELWQLQQVQVYSSGEGLIYTSTGQIKGISCKLWAGLLFSGWYWIPSLSELNGKTPEEAAMTQLKIKALKTGGNAILSPTCSHNAGTDWANNCFESWICAAEAVRVE